MKKSLFFCFFFALCIPQNTISKEAIDNIKTVTSAQRYSKPKKGMQEKKDTKRENRFFDNTASATTTRVAAYGTGACLGLFVIGVAGWCISLLMH